MSLPLHLPQKRILFIHQNFPGQFRHMAPALQSCGYDVLALGVGGTGLTDIKMVRYKMPDKAEMAPRAAAHRGHFDTMLDNGLACARAMWQLKASGYEPDLVIAHPGWGEALFAKDVWPQARLVVFHEFYYTLHGADSNFDPEFPAKKNEDAFRIRINNTHLLHALAAADGVLTPTRWQQERLPLDFRAKSTVIFDGIDTALAAPNATAFIDIPRLGLRLTRQDPVITFVNRNLEPYRGFHIFMRALPRILERCPDARVLVAGGDEVSYGAPPPGGGSWRNYLLAELGATFPKERVHFIGRVPYDLYLRVLQVSSCHVYLTYPFVLGWSCVEALAAGCAVVGSATAPVQELITDEVNGRLVGFFDQDTLVAKVCETLSNRSAFEAMRMRARKHIVEHYDLKTRCLPQQLAYVKTFL